MEFILLEQLQIAEQLIYQVVQEVWQFTVLKLISATMALKKRCLKDVLIGIKK